MSSGDLYKKRAPGYIKTGATGGARDMAAFSYACPSGEDCTNVASVVNETTGAILITAANLAPNTVYAVCPDVDLGLCDKRLLKGGLIHEVGHDRRRCRHLPHHHRPHLPLLLPLLRGVLPPDHR